MRYEGYFDSTLTVTNNGETLHFFGSFYHMYNTALKLATWYRCSWSILRDSDAVIIAQSKVVQNG